MGTSKQAEGDRVSTISHLGRSTSVALAMGPTDKEEEEHCTVINIVISSALQR